MDPVFIEIIKQGGLLAVVALLIWDRILTQRRLDFITDRLFTIVETTAATMQAIPDDMDRLVDVIERQTDQRQAERPAARPRRD